MIYKRHNIHGFVEVDEWSNFRATFVDALNGIHAKNTHDAYYVRHGKGAACGYVTLEELLNSTDRWSRRTVERLKGMSGISN